MSNVGIYKITNPIGAVYIGQSHNIPIRMKNLKNQICSRPRKLYLSIFKYGWDNHIKEIVHELPKDVSQEVLNIYEKLYMDCYKDCGVELLNIKEGGLDGKHNKESINLMKIFNSRYNKGQPSLFKGKKHTQDAIDKMSKFQKGRKKPPRSEEYRKNISLAHIGKKCPLLSRKVVCSESGVVYTSIGEAAIAKGLNYSTLSSYLNGSKKNKSTLKYYNNGS